MKRYFVFIGAFWVSIGVVITKQSVVNTTFFYISSYFHLDPKLYDSLNFLLMRDNS